MSRENVSESTVERGETLTRRQALTRAGRLLAAIGVAVVGVSPAFAKIKANRDDFFYQEEPGENGKKCSGCTNFSPKSTGKYGADSGDCGLVEGDVCSHCYCESWTDKLDPKSKKAGT
jgi:hypothetical protein